MVRTRCSRQGASATKPSFLGKLFARRPARTVATRVAARLGIEQLEPRLAMAGVVINEFLALNTSGIQDQDGDRSDWIELHNTDATPVDLTGWHLTDDNTELDKWQLPATNLAAGGYLVIFASEKDRAVTGQELHTNFALEQNGEFLALVKPDGTTITDSFAPFPEQLENVSYGRGASSLVSESLIDEEAPTRAFVPTNNSVDATWFTTGFNDSGWLAGTLGVGFDTNGSGQDFLPYINLDVGAQMAGVRNSAYVRMPFDVVNPTELTSLILKIRYDDGFAVYLNGTEINSARRNTPAGTPTFNWAASASHADAAAVVYENIDLSSFRHLLQPGANVLAIHGLNRNTSSLDFLIDPLLVADRLSAAVTGYMVTPTPGAANVQGTLGFVADTKFSVDRGFYNSLFNVEITSVTAGAEIRYSLDGSAPTATTGLVYNPLSPPLITTTTTLRAAAFKTGFTPSNVDTQTYIFLDDVIQQDGAGLPAHADWGWVGPDWTVDPDVVNDPLYAGTIKNDLQAVPTVSLVMPWNDWFGDGGQGIYISGTNIERQGSIEFFTASGSEEFQIDAALEIQGGTSADRWKTDKLSFRGTFKAPFGPTKLDTDLFNHPFFDGGAAIDFDTLIFDAQINYTWPYGGGSNPLDQRGRAKFIQDQIVADLQNLAGGHAPHGRLVHLYLNGLYWGMYDLHERPDESFAESYLGGDKDDYDVIKHNSTTVVAGDMTALGNYADMLNLVRQDMAVPANYAAVVQKVDIDGLIDYMIINYYAGNDDWAHHNWYATFNRVDPNGKWRFHSWDAEHVFKDVNYDAIFTGGLSGTPEEVHQRLVVNDEYRLRFVDHVQKLFYNGGLLTPDSVAAVYLSRMQEADRAIVGESARWGDSHTTASEPAYYTREHWLATQNDLLANYFPQRSSVVINQFGSRQWRVNLAAPLMSQFGGIVSAGFALTLSMPVGAPAGASIYYTLDGSDPRDPATNLPRASAIAYTAPITVNAGARVKARIYLDDALSSTINEWSPIVDATFLLETPFPVRITELHYNPAPQAGVADPQDMEFFELTNTGGETVSLAGVQITAFAENPYVFGAGLNLGPGQRIIVAKNPTVFQQVYGSGFNMAPSGYGTANLSNGGEPIRLLGPLGEVLQDFTYDDAAGWPASPDGGGPSLEIINPLGDPGSAVNWRASLYVGGSPGASGLPGDYDGNGFVQEADYNAWRAGFGNSVGKGSEADGNRDGAVDAADYVVWRKAMMGAASGAAVVHTIVAPTAGASEKSGSEGAIAVSPLPAETQPESESRPLSIARTAAVDMFFSRLDGTRPTTRPAFASPVVTRAADNQLLLARVAVASDATETDAVHFRTNSSAKLETSIDKLLTELVGNDNDLNLI